MPSHAVIIGAGIAGLAAATALRNRSWRVTVLERDAAPAEVGAGITLWPNALRALDELGVGSRIRSRGLTQATGGIRSSSGRWLARTDTQALARRFGDGIVVLERGDLLSVLLDACTDADIHTSTGAVGVAADGTVRYTSSSGAAATITADVVIGADGLRSATRRSLWPESAGRSTGMIAARLVGHVDGPVHDVGGETWGRGDYAGLAPLPDGRVYAYLVAPASGSIPPEAEAGLRWWQHRFAGWHHPIPQLLAGADANRLLLNELYELRPLSSLAEGRVALIGDAGHAMTPNLGQGACQALEDAVELAAVLPVGVDIVRQLAEYNRRRLSRVHMIARRSRIAGIAAASRGRIPTAVRNAAVSLTPAHVALRGLDSVIGWSPPARISVPEEH